MNTKATPARNASIQTKLTPGTYRLLETCEPLRKDKRCKRDWRYSEIEAGRLFFYSEWTYAPNDARPEVTVTECRLYPVGCYSSESVSPNESHLTRKLEELLVPVDETPSLWLRREHGGNTALGVLDALVESGKLTLGDVQAAALAHLGRLELTR